MVEHADRSSTALANFVKEHGLDGIDIDWEYPGAPDIPEIPAGKPTDGANYLNFLKLLRSKLPQSKSLSIAAPASYWYLKAFPIAEMSKYLDYIVFMTYVLHGQWDYGNAWTGEYLKSHVDWPETQQMLNLITHAGVPSNKVILGIAKYGRSFQQQNPTCYGPECKFTGPDSGAIPGKCTGTSGYLALGEIKEIVNSNQNVRKHYEDNGSQILVWGNDQWVSYLTDEQIAKKNRFSYRYELRWYSYLGYGFGRYIVRYL